MTNPIDPRVAYTVTNAPRPSPSPGPSPSPPAPSHAPPARPGTDIGVTPSELRARGDDCHAVAETVKKTKGVGDDACADLRRAAREWEFVQSIDDMQKRWDDLNDLVWSRLMQASNAFNLSSAGYSVNEERISRRFTDILR